MFFDTSVWSPLDLLSLYRLVGPEQVLYASDYPYGQQPASLVSTVRTARLAEMTESELRELLAGNAAAAERELRWGVDTLREIGEFAWLPTVAGILAEAVSAQGRDEEAEEVVTMGEETAGSDDAYSQGLLRSVRAKSLARRGQVEEAERLAREAVAVAEPTDFLFLQSLARTSLGEVLQLAGREEEAEAVLAEAVDLAEQKGYVVGAGRGRALIEGAASTAGGRE